MFKSLAMAQLAILLLGIGYLAGCKGHSPHPTTVNETIAAYEGDTAELEIDDLTRDVSTIAVILEDGEAFFTETRHDKLTAYPCTQCHIGPIAPSTTPIAHFDRQLEHGKRMDCLTCHDATKNMAHLRLISGQSLDFDQVYELCGQCHFQELRDWRGGSHGKRLQGWAGTRIVRNCTSCHDPHSPKFPKRFPSFSPTPAESRILDPDIGEEDHGH